ncbi:MAG: SDR family oxidoreductase [bacterium]
MPRNILIVGASKGLGKSILQSIPDVGDTVFTVSRTKIDLLGTDFRIVPIQADLAKNKNLNIIYKTIGLQSLDTIIYNAGIWEEFDFENESDENLSNIIQVNLTSAILIIKNLIPNLRLSKKANIILIGSTAGLENTSSDWVAYSASKFGLRGLTHSLRNYLKKDRVAVSVLNIGGLQTELSVPNADLSEKNIESTTKIPYKEVTQTIDWILSLSVNSCPKEVDLPSMLESGI